MKNLEQGNNIRFCVRKNKILENELEWRRLEAGRQIEDHYFYFFSQIEYVNVLRGMSYPVTVHL